MRNRMIQEKIWTSEQFMLLSRDARLLFIGLLNIADDNGILKKSKLSIKAAIFPSDNLDIEPLIEEIINSKLAYCYRHLEIVYMIITNFTKYQKVNHPTFIHPIPCDEDLDLLGIEKSPLTDEYAKTRSCTLFKLSVKDNKNDRTLIGHPEDVDRTLIGHPSKNLPNIIESNIDKNKLSKNNTLSSTEVDNRNAVFNLFINKWNENFKDLPIPKIISFPEKRKKGLTRLLKNHSQEEIDLAFQKIKSSDFLLGNGDKKNWKCNFDFFISENNFTKIIEGNYDNKNISNMDDNYFKFLEGK